MKVETEQSNNFVPIKLTLTIENENELMDLWNRLDLSPADVSASIQYYHRKYTSYQSIVLSRSSILSSRPSILFFDLLDNIRCDLGIKK